MLLCTEKRAKTTTTTTATIRIRVTFKRVISHFVSKMRKMAKTTMKKVTLLLEWILRFKIPFITINYISIPEKNYRLTFTSLFFLNVTFPGSDTRAHYSNDSHSIGTKSFTLRTICCFPLHNDENMRANLKSKEEQTFKW